MMWEYRCVKLQAKAEAWGNAFFSVLKGGGDFDAEGLEKGMNQLGQEGWELASAMDTNAIYGATRHIVLLFKRPKA